MIRPAGVSGYSAELAKTALPASLIADSLLLATPRSERVASRVVALFITTNTVANHVKNILSKSNTENRTAAATYGVRHGLAED